MVKRTKKGKLHYFLGATIGALAATLCCISPLIIVVLGFGTAFGMAVMHKFHTASIVSGVLIVLLASAYAIKKRAGVCSIRTVKKNWTIPVTAIALLIVLWLVINYAIVYPIAKQVYGNLPVEKKPLGNLIEMAREHGMQLDAVKVIPENQGTKKIIMTVQGVFCGSCGPALEYDIKSIEGVKEVILDGESKFEVTYNSNITSKNIILATIHEPYTANIVQELCARQDQFLAC